MRELAAAYLQAINPWFVVSVILAAGIVIGLLF